MIDRRQREKPSAERLLRRGLVEVALEPGCKKAFGTAFRRLSKRSRLIPVIGLEAGSFFGFAER